MCQFNSSDCKKLSQYFYVFLIFIFFLLTGCGQDTNKKTDQLNSDDTTKTDNTAKTTDTTKITDTTNIIDSEDTTTINSAGNTVSVADIAAFADNLYSLKEESSEESSSVLNGELQKFFKSLGMAVLANNNETDFTAEINAGRPALLEMQIDAILRGLKNNQFYSIRSWVVSMTEFDIQTIDPSESFTYEFLTEKMMEIAVTDNYTVDTYLLGLVIQLGRARARKARLTEIDTVWSDGMLDPLQLELLNLAVFFGSSQRSGVSGRLVKELPSSVMWPIEQILDTIMEEWTKMPIDPKGAAQATLAASLLLYGHTVTVEADNSQLHHKHPENPDEVPWNTQVRAYVEFTDKYDDYDRLWLERLSGATIPLPGPRSGIEVKWEAWDIEKHGSFEFSQTTTNNEGKVITYWKTIDEIVPKPLRRIEKYTTGLILCKATGLLPAKWRNLELITSSTTGAVGQVRMQIGYYEMPNLTLDFESKQIITSKEPFEGRVVGLQIPMELVRPNPDNLDGAYYKAERALSYPTATFQPDIDKCTWTFRVNSPGYIRAELPVPDESATELTLFLLPGNYAEGPNEFFSIVCPKVPPQNGITVFWWTGWGTHYENRMSESIGPLQAPRYVFTEQVGTTPLFSHEGSGVITQSKETFTNYTKITITAND